MRMPARLLHKLGTLFDYICFGMRMGNRVFDKLNLSTMLFRYKVKSVFRISSRVFLVQLRGLIFLYSCEKKT